jgi:HSP20 family protein
LARDAEAPEIHDGRPRGEKGYRCEGGRFTGVKKEDINTSRSTANQISIGAMVKKETKRRRAETIIEAERLYGNPVPGLYAAQDIAQRKAEAQYADGLLNLTLPKKEPARSNK